jgi:hypothetical protein
LKLAVIMHVAPPASVCPLQVSEVLANWPGSLPVAWTVSEPVAAVPVFVTTIVATVALVWPTWTSPNGVVAGATARSPGLAPVPLIDAEVTLPVTAAWTEALRTPAAVGEKVTPTVQVAAGASVWHVFAVMWKSVVVPWIATWTASLALGPVFVIVKVIADVLVWPMVIEPKSLVSGEIASDAGSGGEASPLPS